MYGLDWILLIAGIILIIINIVIIVKFFEMSNNIEKITNLYVYGKKELDNGDVEYYKLPLEKDIEKEERIQKTKGRASYSDYRNSLYCGFK